MDQTISFATDVVTVLLCADNAQLDRIGEALRRLLPAYVADPVIAHCAGRLTQCPHIVAEYVELAAAAPDIPNLYDSPEANLVAAALAEANIPAPAQTDIVDLEAQLLQLAGRSPRSARQELALAVAAVRKPLLDRAKRYGLPQHAEPLSRRGASVPAPFLALDPKEVFSTIERMADRLPFMRAFTEQAMAEERKLGRVNILVAGKSGVGKSTLVNAVFGGNVAETGVGRPVTQHITWYEPPGIPVRLCDSKGLELQQFESTLADLEHEITRANASGQVADRIHILWLCILEPGARIEDGEKRLVALCAQHSIPTLVVLTKAIGPRDFIKTVRQELPGAHDVVRVLAEPWEMIPSYGLPDLIRATDALLPDATRAAFEAAQQVDVGRKRARALKIAMAAAGTAAAAAATPIPVVDAGAVFAVNTGMIAAIAAAMGVQMSQNNMLTLGASMLGAMGAAAGGRLIAGELLKLIPGLGSIVGGVITSSIAASATYGLGLGFTEFLCRFHASQQRMPDGNELRDGFRRFWESWEKKEQAPPKQ